MRFRIGDIIGSIFLVVLAVFLVCQTCPQMVAWAAGIVLSAPVEPGGPFGAVDSNNVKGGLHHLNYSSQLRGFPEHLKYKGLLVHVRENDSYYRAYSTNGHFWVNVVFGAGGGATVHNNLTGRDANDAHPIAGITGLTAELAAKLNSVEFWNRTAAFRGTPGAAGRDGSDGATGPAGESYRLLGTVEAIGNLPTSHNAGDVWIVSANGHGYRWTGSAWLDIGKLKGDRGYDARTPKTLSCGIYNEGNSAGQTIVYDEYGSNPQPTSFTLTGWLWEDGTPITATSYEWYVPPVNSQLVPPASTPDGMQLKGQTVQVGVQSYYSSSRTINYARLLQMYSTARFPYAKRYCTARIPIPAVLRGPKGLKGDTATASVTEAAIMGAMSTARSDVPFTLRPYANNTSAKLVIRDRNGNVRHYTTGWGYSYWRTPDGDTTVMIESDGCVYTRKAGLTRTKVCNDGSVIIYRNGQPVFDINSTGYYKGREGYPTNVSKTRPYVTPSGYRGYTTGGTGSGGMSNPFTLPTAGQTFRAPSGTTRHEFYTSGRTKIKGTLTIY